MIIKQKTAERLIKSGKAKKTTTVTHNSDVYQAINRYEKQRVDHYFLYCK